VRNVLLVNLLLLAVALAAWGEYTAVRTRMPAREEARGAVAELERALAPADKIRANSELSAALAKLPRPKSEEALDRLSDAENRIAVERRRYNEMLEHYNALIQRFPDNIVARLAGFQRDPNYLPTEEQEPVQK